MKQRLPILLLLLLLLLLLTSPASAVNFFASDATHIPLLLRFDNDSSLGLNSAHSADGTETGVDWNTTLEKEGSGCADWDDGFGGDITITHANQPTTLFDGGDFTICGWFRLGTVGAKTLLNQGTEGSNLSVKLEVHDAGATESFQVVLGYGDGSSSDTYTHASDLNGSSWYWVGVTVDINGNVRIRVYQDGVGALGSDIYTACSNAYTANSQSVVIGDYFDGFMDELVVFNRALDIGELDAVRAGTFNSGSAPFSYYCSPSGSNDRIGTSSIPWGPLDDLVGAQILGRYVNEGDTIYLKTGNQGAINLGGATDTERKFTSYIYIKAQAGQTPYMTGMTVTGAQYWYVDGELTVGDGTMDLSPVADGSAATYGLPPRRIVYGSKGSGQHHLYFTNVEVYNIDDSSGWTTEDHWTYYAYRAFETWASYFTLDTCEIRNVAEGASGFYEGSTITNCTLSGFAENGFYTGGYDDITITHNIITDSHWHDDANYDWHCDAIQCSGIGTARNLNVSYNYVNTRYTPGLVLPGYSQGFTLTCNIIGGVVQNNVSMVHNATNSMTFSYGPYGEVPARTVTDLLIANNTVVHPYNYYKKNTISFQDTTNCSDITVINNIAYTCPSNGGPFTSYNNIQWRDAGYDFNDIFVNFEYGDVDLAAGSPLINQGTSLYDAPTDDLDETARDATPDVGAYEYGGAAPTDPPDPAYNPSPADDATGVSATPTLTWSVDGYTDNVDVYFGTVSGSLTSIGNQQTNSYAPGSVNYSIEYFWRIDANNAYGTTTGTEWSFTVADEPATPTTNNFADDPNCVALWRLETGYLTTDSIGSNTLSNLGVVASSAAHQEGDTSGLWDTANGDDYLVIADSALSADFPLKSGGDESTISVCMWVYFESDPDGTLQFIWTKWSDTNKSVGLFVYDSSGIRWGLGNGATTEEHQHISTAVQVGRWYHIGATYDSSNDSYRLRIYDATADSVTEDTGTSTVSVGTCAEPVSLGSDADRADSLDGRLDEVVVFNDILTAAQIDAIRNGTYLVEQAVGTRPHRPIIVNFN